MRSEDSIILIYFALSVLSLLILAGISKWTKRVKSDSISGGFINGLMQFFLGGFIFSFFPGTYRAWGLVFDHEFLNMFLTGVTFILLLLIFFLYRLWIEKRKKKSKKNIETSS